jgi:ribosome-binding factor A
VKLPRQASQRQLRVGEEIRHALSHILTRTGFRDPELQKVNPTVTEVRVSPDMKNATVFIVPLGDEDGKAVAGALNRASGYIRGLLGRAVRLRFTPRLSFEHDYSFDQARTRRWLDGDARGVRAIWHVGARAVTSAAGSSSTSRPA